MPVPARLRHGFVVHALNKTPRRTLQRWMGHSDQDDGDLACRPWARRREMAPPGLRGKTAKFGIQYALLPHITVVKLPCW